MRLNGVTLNWAAVICKKFNRSSSQSVLYGAWRVSAHFNNWLSIFDQISFSKPKILSDCLAFRAFLSFFLWEKEITQEQRTNERTKERTFLSYDNRQDFLSFSIGWLINHNVIRDIYILAANVRFGTKQSNKLAPNQRKIFYMFYHTWYVI